MKKIGYVWLRAHLRQVRWHSFFIVLALIFGVTVWGNLSLAQQRYIPEIGSNPKITLIAKADSTINSGSEATSKAEDSVRDLKYPPKSKEPIKVLIGIHITNLADINQTSESFDIAGYLMYSWQDPRLAFKPSDLNDRTTKTSSLDEIWHPAIEMVNFKQSENSETSATILPDGTVQAQERFSKTLSSSLSLQNFPFDQQSLQVILESLNYGEETVNLLTDSPKISIGTDSFVGLSEWEIGIISGSNDKSYFLPENQYYSRVTIDIHIKRNAGFYILKVIMPLLLITIASWSVFWIDTKEFSTQIGIAFTNLLTVVALLLVINDTLPRVGYLTLMDGFTMLCFIVILVAILELVFAHQLEVNESHQQAQKLHYKARWVVPIGFVVSNLILVGVMHLLTAH